MSLFYPFNTVNPYSHDMILQDRAERYLRQCRVRAKRYPRQRRVRAERYPRQCRVRAERYPRQCRVRAERCLRQCRVRAEWYLRQRWVKLSECRVKAEWYPRQRWVKLRTVWNSAVTNLMFLTTSISLIRTLKVFVPKVNNLNIIFIWSK